MKLKRLTLNATILLIIALSCAASDVYYIIILLLRILIIIFTIMKARGLTKIQLKFQI